MNNKGFTLVELLAVMVILLSISVVTVTNVTASLKRNDKQEKENQIKLVINAAKIYFSIHNVDCMNSEQVVDFIEEGELDFDIDKLIDNEFVIYIGDNDYIYEEGGSC